MTYRTRHYFVQEFYILLSMCLRCSHGWYLYTWSSMYGRKNRSYLLCMLLLLIYHKHSYNPAAVILLCVTKQELKVKFRMMPEILYMFWSLKINIRRPYNLMFLILICDLQPTFTLIFLSKGYVAKVRRFIIWIKYLILISPFMYFGLWLVF